MKSFAPPTQEHRKAPERVSPQGGIRSPLAFPSYSRSSLALASGRVLPARAALVRLVKCFDERA